MSSILKRINISYLIKSNIRYKGTLNKPAHSSEARKKKKTVCDKALEHFNEFYESVYGSKLWEEMRAAMTSERHKYVAVVNNHSDTERIKTELEELGAMNLKLIYDVFKNQLNERKARALQKKLNKKRKQEDDELRSLMEEKKITSLSSIFPNDDVTEKEFIDDDDDLDNIIKNKKPPLPSIPLKSIDENATISTDSNRIIHPTEGGMSASSLYEFLPATKLKGMEDYITESEHYGFYIKGADFNIIKEDEDHLHFPENLHMYVFEKGNTSYFPKPKKGKTNVIDYYVLDGASILPVLSLGLQHGDVVLDMCASPGGKSVTILQTLLPKMLVANDIMQSRVNKIYRFFDEVFMDSEVFQDFYFITQRDASVIDEKNTFNKILVDVPCTTDRHALHEEDNNIFKSTRIKERLQLPEYQTEILTNALQIVAPGGTVVYSTCTLSPVQNDGVVQVSLKRAFEESNVSFVVKDQTLALAPLSELYKFGTVGVKYGHIVLPTLQNNWGPMYFCKMVRVQ